MPHPVDHVELGHRVDEERVAVFLRHPCVDDVVLGSAVEERSGVLKGHPVDAFDDVDPRAGAVVGVGNAVVDCLQDGLAVVLLDLGLDERVGRQHPDLDIADALVDAVRVEQERQAEVLVRGLLAGQLPGDLGQQGQQVVRRVRAPEQEHRRARDAAIAGETGALEERRVVPTLDLGRVEPRMTCCEGHACGHECFGVEVVDGGVRDHHRRPVVAGVLLPDLVELGEIERAEALAVARVVVAVPGDRDPTRCRWNLEEEYPAVGVVELVDLVERRSR